MTNYFSNGKVMIIHLIVVLLKKILLYKKWVVFFKPYTYVKNKIKIELDLCNYATKFDLKRLIGLNTAQFAKNADLASFKKLLKSWMFLT